MNCCMCDKNLGLFDSYNKLKSFRWDVPFDKESLCVCGECSILLRRLIFVNNMESEACNDQKGKKAIKEYRELVKANENTILHGIEDSWLKNEMISRIKSADVVTDVYEKYDEILHKAFEVITSAYYELPENKMEFGIETFAKDDNNFYYMEFGRQITISDELLNIDTVGEKRKIIELLSRSIMQPIITIPLERILYYQEKGDISYSTSVSGGGATSKGVSIAGAMAGKLMFGNVGALIGSQVGTGIDIEEIQSETIEHDNRYIVFRYIDLEGKTVENKFPYEYIEVFSTMIPEKEYSHIQLEKSTNTTPVKVSSNSSIPVEELKKLKELLDIGIITYEEFDAKKKQLLGL